MNAYNEIDGIVCTADRELLTAIAARRVGVRRLRRLGLLLDPAARGLPPARGGRGGARRRWRSSAGLDVELPATDCYGAAAPARDRRRARQRGDARRGGAARAAARSSTSGSSTSRTSTSAPRCRRRRHGGAPRARAHDRAEEHRAAEERRRPSACPPSSGSIAVIGPNADTARNLFGDYAYPAHVESLAERARQRAEQSLDSRCRSSAEIAPAEIEAPSVLDALRGSGYGSSGLVRPRAATSAGSSDDGFAEAVELAAAADVAVHGDGRQVRSHRGLHERRVPRPCLVRPPGRAGGARPRGARRRARPSSSCSSRAGPSASAWAARAVRRGRRWRGSPARKARSRSPTSSAATSNPGGKLPDLVPASGRAGARSSTRTRPRAGGPIRSATTSTCRRAPLYPFGHGLSYTTFELSELRDRREQTVRWSGELVVDVRGRPTRASGPATRSCSSTSATRRRASRGR